MALPPPWIAVYEVARAQGMYGMMRGDAQELVAALEVRGWSIVPTWAVPKWLSGLQLDEFRVEVDPEVTEALAGVSEEELEQVRRMWPSKGTTQT